MTFMPCPHCGEYRDNNTGNACPRCGKSLSSGLVATFTVPGDDFRPDPIIKRGEELERIRPAGGVLTEFEARELAAIKEYARLRSVLREVADDPKTLFTDEARRPLIHGIDDPATAEDESDYLGAQLSRSAREREAAAMLVLRTLGRLGGPLLLSLLKAELTKGLEAAHVPPALAPFVSVVEAAAMDAAGQVVKDVAG